MLFLAGSPPLRLCIGCHTLLSVKVTCRLLSPLEIPRMREGSRLFAQNASMIHTSGDSICWDDPIKTILSLKQTITADL